MELCNLLNQGYSIYLLIFPLQFINYGSILLSSMQLSLVCNSYVFAIACLHLSFVTLLFGFLSLARVWGEDEIDHGVGHLSLVNVVGEEGCDQDE